MNAPQDIKSYQNTPIHKEVGFTSFPSGGVTTFAMVYLTDEKLVNPTSVHCAIFRKGVGQCEAHIFIECNAFNLF